MMLINRPIVSVAAILASVSCAVGASSAERRLEKLGQQVRSSRAPGSNARCPNQLDILVGVSRADVLLSLGDADFCSGPAGTPCSQSLEWTYFLIAKSDRPAGRGGGFPELTFDFDSSLLVTNVQCHYSR